MGDDVIVTKLKQFQIPVMGEGWDSIKLMYYEPSFKSFYGKINDWIVSLNDYDQENSHHALTLGRHMETAHDHCVRNYVIDHRTHMAVYAHDIGKPVCYSHVNCKGENDGNAHYYNHNNVGAYLSLFFDMKTNDDNDRLAIALLIELHMKPHVDWKQYPHVKERDRKLFGDRVIKSVEILHECDVAAH